MRISSNNSLVAILLPLAILFSCTNPSQSIKNQPTKVDEYVNNVIERYGIPGAALAIIQNGEIQHQKYYKLASLELKVPVGDSNLFQLSSLSKIFTSTAVFQLIENQKISIEDHVSDYLDDLPQDWQNIRIKHLLSHTSGLPEIARFHKLPEDSAKSSVYLEPVQFTQGSSSRYTNTNFWLLKRIIEQVTGQNFSNFVLEGQFDPPDRSVIYAGDYYNIVPGRATSYEPNQEGVFQLRQYEFPVYLYGAAGMNISLNKFINWNKRLDDNEIIAENTKLQMWTPFKLNNNEPIDFTYGWHMRQPNNRTSLGFSGGYNTGFRKYTEDDLSIILLTNGYESRFNIERVIESIAGLVDEDLENNRSQLRETLIMTFLEDENQVAIKTYRKLKKKYADRDFEGILNAIGYELLGLNEVKTAIDVFKINVKEYPNSWNVFDSLGEAYEIQGDKARAIENYRKSIVLNPDNTHAKNKIESLLNTNK